MTLQEAMQIRLQAKQISGAALARRVGVTKHEIYNILKGRNFPRLDLLEKILTELDIKMNFKI